MKKSTLNEAVCKELFTIGVPANLLGFSYIRQSITLCYDNPQYLRKITGGLYPEIAKKNNTTPSRVERTIRHAIEVAWNRGNTDVLTEYFGYTIEFDKGKPTNSHFIAQMVEVIRNKLQKGSE